jgi:hypothetical protein
MEIQFWDVKKMGMLYKKTGLPRDKVKFANLYLEEFENTKSIWSVDNDLATFILRRILILDHGMSTILLYLDLYCEESNSTIDVVKGSMSNSSNPVATTNYNIH